MKYCTDAKNPAKAAKARGDYMRCHFKHLREIAQDIRGRNCDDAKKFLKDVLKFKQAVTFRRFRGGVGRHAQGKLAHAPASQVRWPQKATRMVLDLLINAEANAKEKGLSVETMYISHVMANRAPKQRRRTYRAHGRINAYMSSPGHFEMILEEKPVKVPEPDKQERKSSRKNQRVPTGGGVDV